MLALEEILDALDPIVLLLLGGGRHPVHGVLPLNHLAITVGLAGLDHLVARAEELEAVLLTSVSHISDRDVLKWDNSSRFLVGRELEVVEAVVVEDEPSSLPTLVPATLFPEPALLVRVEEGVHQVVPVVLRDLEGLRLDRVEQGDQQLPRQILSIVDPPIHSDELLDTGLVLDARVMQAGVKHDDRKAQHVTGVGVGEYIRVELAISLSKSFHHSVDFLGFSRKPETPQELS